MKNYCAKVFSTVFSAVFCVSAACFPSQHASAAADTVPITGQCYMFSGNGKYNYTDSESIGDTKTVDKLGKLELKADVQRSYVDEMDITVFEIADDTKLELTFTYDNTLRDADEDLWHICSDDSKTINGVDIGAEIKKGAVILQTSYDAEHWGTAQDHVKTNILGSGDETTHTIVFESDSYNNQLMNGCYYRLIVAYRLEKKTPSWPRDDTEHKKRAQVYTFYAGYKDARKEPDPNLKKYSYSDFMKTDLDKGYVNEQMIDGNDPHNGWKLGHFVISGFTQRNEDEEHSEQNVRCFALDKKNLWICLDLVFLIVFNCAFFIIGGSEHPKSVWIAYAFVHLAYLLLLLSPKLVRKSKRSDVYSQTVISISAVHFFVQFLVSVIIMIAKPESYSVSLVIQIVILGFYLVFLFSHMIANESTAQQLQRQETETQYIRDAANRMKPLLESTGVRETDKLIEKVYDVLRTSPARSSIEAASIELEIMNKITDLEKSIKEGDDKQIKRIASALIADLEQRSLIISSKQ